MMHDKESPFFETCWFFMGIVQIALEPHLLSNGQTWKKKCSKPSWQAFTPPFLGNANVETTYFKKGASLTSIARALEGLKTGVSFVEDS